MHSLFSALAHEEQYREIFLDLAFPLMRERSPVTKERGRCAPMTVGPDRLFLSGSNEDDLNR